MQPTPINPTISGENPAHTTIGSKAALCTAQPRTGEALSASVWQQVAADPVAQECPERSRYQCAKSSVGGRRHGKIQVSAF